MVDGGLAAGVVGVLGLLGVMGPAATPASADATAVEQPAEPSDAATVAVPSRPRAVNLDTANVDGVVAEPSEADDAEVDEPTGPRRNTVVMRTHARIPDWAVSFGYQRALGRRFSVGAAFEYGFQPRRYWHLQGMGEVLSGQVWLGRPFHGVFAEASMMVAHQFLARRPKLSTTAIVPGIALGFRWTHRSGLTLGGSGGLRWGRTVSKSDIICTRPKFCTTVRQGAYAHLTADIGFVF
ncbi:MAG: hypothetical protein K0V04_30100 [Deltaproteobacteria bacterium]|nr:hypothetical protein [Deltaproteobacteria bacterium]